MRSTSEGQGSTVDWITRVIIETWNVFLEAAPYVMIGLVAAAFVYTLLPKERVQTTLGKPGFGSILKSALMGIPLPLCSCGVLPTALSLSDRGASRGATVSFLVSTPETGLDSIAVTYALINPAMAILRPISAFISAVAAGLGVDRFGGRARRTESVPPDTCPSCGGKHPETTHSWLSRLRTATHYVFTDFFPDIANWLVLGLVLSGVVAAFVPEGFLASIPGPTQMLMAVIAGVPIYICASASTPIAAVLMAKGVSPGAALVFLLVGPATNLASMLVIGRRLGTRTAIVYLSTLILAALAIGYATDVFLGGLNWFPKIADPELLEHFGLFHYVGALFLGLGILHVWWRKVTMKLVPKPKATASESSSIASRVHSH
jgi:uncharacterized membrane protein YraQ (UPF0718 family)